ncbi:alpha-amylase family glycosyl hydrolase [Allomuricauda sp. SCSIO 65647]|uniref:alpha-amylase family glycosyl hydrolase n=1 Tax=Allomuricauda sp. SCSIO 65647 TaxID=2908843 RepID=UPI001F18C5E7|nr:alpha-amylase family glycosyl hydrolase [Muricauda sp. SCSIO 65647]UJH66242.1 T9SS type A sorting domain-containing protein [Muricauda sp. SCSIO 65647]
MAKKIQALFFFLLSVGLLAQQQEGVFTIDPPTFNEDDEITITVSGIDPSLWGVSDVYLWAWYFDASGTQAGDSPTNGTWENSNEVQRMTDNGDGTFSYTLTPTSFYGATGISRIGMLAKAKNGTGDKKTQDNIVDVGGYQLVLTAPTQSTTLIDAGTEVTITAATSIASTYTLTANGTIVDNVTTASTDYSYTTTINTTTNFVLEATDGANTESASFTYAIRPTVIEEALPVGLLDGINLNPSDPTMATLVLYAPNKEFVHVIGDFNNWTVNDSYLMKKDSGQDRFWLELTGLTPQFDHLYQYLVELDINIADPYSTLILDGYGNDSFIDETTYPNLPEYPTGQTEAITVLRTGDAEYPWSDATLNFQKPKKTDLVVYELLIRDFDALHSFDAVKARLDYLEDLGINAIEFMPLNEFDGNESWGYNPSFHMALDKYYGTKEAFKSLVDECHARGIAVIVDVVYNHASGQHPYYRMWNTDNGGTGGQASSENPFFNVVATHSYSVFNDFNHQQQATRDYVNRTVTYWIEEYRIDGMRWDLTKGFTQNCSSSDESCTNSTQNDRIEVLKGYADNQWASDPDSYIIFEHLGGIQEEKQWADYRLNEGKGILLWNKQTDPYNEATMGYHESGKSNFSAVSYQVKGFDNPAAMSYMESHDEERLMYKNLEFGNVEGDYSVKELDTALERMQTAGAFFFTIPGPKMIWQFGELGYEISINENGRTGNKPIRWEYLNDSNRTAIYDTWGDLIKLKLGEDIFETTDFTMDLDASSGLKTIHLTNPNAMGDAIKYVTIIGNFGMTTLDIDPQFQETGVWYEFLEDNQKYIVEDVNAPISLDPGEFRIFGDQLSTVFPDGNIPDEDNDGVADGDDLCPNTPLGTTVDVSGCEIFTLPADNFAVKTTSETCRSSNNGSISITATTALEYTANMSGNGTGSQSFNETVVFDGLTAGDYTICITVAGQTEYEQCFEVTVTEPEDLSVSSKVESTPKKLTLNLKGGRSYEISLNNRIFRTDENSIVLDLETSVNRLSVKTDNDCQGIYEETIILEGMAVAYPNPLPMDQLTIEMSQFNNDPVAIEVFGIDGKLLMKQTKTLENGSIIIDMSALQSGLYFINVYENTKTHHFKIAKQ